MSVKSSIKKKILVLCWLGIFVLSQPFQLAAQGFDERINAALRPIADGLSDFIFFSLPIFGTDVPLIIVWLIGAAVFFTVYFNFLNFTGFRHAISLVKGDYSSGKDAGDVNHFQALSTALSGTVGIGNIGGVAILITIGGPGAVFWMIFAGMVGMSTKFVECVLGVMYRKINPDGSISGGPMYLSLIHI